MTDEDVGLVDSWYQRAKPRYPIVILEGDEFESALGVKFFPTGAVLDPQGKIAYAGSAGGTSSPLKDALSDGLSTPLFPKELSKVQSKMAADDLVGAWTEVLAVKQKATDENAVRWTERFETSLAGQAAAALAQARQQNEAGLMYRAVEILEPIAAAKQPFPVTEEAATWLKELEESDGYDVELKAGALYAKGVEDERENDFTAAAKQFVKAAEKFPDTRLAVAARQRADDIVTRGLPGYNSNCNDCRSVKRACDKHAEKVKL